MITPPRIRGLVQKLERAVRMEFHDKANRPRRKSETAVARVELLRAISLLALCSQAQQGDSHDT